MKLIIGRAELVRLHAATAKVVESRNVIPILSSLRLSAEGGKLTVTATDLDILVTASGEADVQQSGQICVDAKLLGDIARKASGDISIALDGDKLAVKFGRSRFSLATLPVADFPNLDGGDYTASFDIDLASLFEPVKFAISNEQARFFLCGIYFIGSPDGGASIAVATDGHRLARHMGPVLPEFGGVIVPAKTVGLLPKGMTSVCVSSNKIRIEAGDTVITSKLIDGTFPDYERVIPRSNDNVATIDRDEFLKATDRVVTVSSEKSKSVKLSIASGSISFTAHSDIGNAEDEVAAEYSGDTIEIGFNSQYLKDMLSVLPSGPVSLALADSGSPGLVTGGIDGWTGVIMPRRV